jgi:hypothetical protein
MPEPVASFKIDDPADMDLAKNAIGGSALEKAFAPGGGGVEEILENCRQAKAVQQKRKQEAINDG